MPQIKAADDINSWYTRLIALWNTHKSQFSLGTAPTAPASAQNTVATAAQMKALDDQADSFYSKMTSSSSYTAMVGLGMPGLQNKSTTAWEPAQNSLILESLRNNVMNLLTAWENWCPDINSCTSFNCGPLACGSPFQSCGAAMACGSAFSSCGAAYACGGSYGQSYSTNCPAYDCPYSSTTNCPGFSCSSTCLQVAGHTGQTSNPNVNHNFNTSQ